MRTSADSRCDLIHLFLCPFSRIPLQQETPETAIDVKHSSTWEQYMGLFVTLLPESGQERLHRAQRPKAAGLDTRANTEPTNQPNTAVCHPSVRPSVHDSSSHQPNKPHTPPRHIDLAVTHAHSLFPHCHPADQINKSRSAYVVFMPLTPKQRSRPTLPGTDQAALSRNPARRVLPPNTTTNAARAGRLSTTPNAAHTTPSLLPSRLLQHPYRTSKEAFL